MSSPFTALIDIDEGEQVKEIEEYMKSNGAPIPDATEESESSNEELFQRLMRIVEHCPTIFQNEKLPQNVLEEFFFSVISLIHVVPTESQKGFIEHFCQQVLVSSVPENGPVMFRILGLMMSHFTVQNPLCYLLFCYRIKLACQVGLSSSLVIDVEKLKSWIEGWFLTDLQKRELYHLLWGAVKDSSDKSVCSQLLTELLRCYPESMSGSVKDLAERLVVLVISDPQMFVFEHLLELGPIRGLQFEKIYTLLEIFVCKNLSSFTKFYEDNREFVDELGLDHSFCVWKMQLLTLTNLCVGSKEVPFSLLTSELTLDSEELELLIIEAVRKKLLNARINQVDNTLTVMSSVHRTFGRENWHLIHDSLSLWKNSIHSVMTGLQTIKP